MKTAKRVGIFFVGMITVVSDCQNLFAAERPNRKALPVNWALTCGVDFFAWFVSPGTKTCVASHTTAFVNIAAPVRNFGREVFSMVLYSYAAPFGGGFSAIICLCDVPAKPFGAGLPVGVISSRDGFERLHGLVR